MITGVPSSSAGPYKGEILPVDDVQANGSFKKKESVHIHRMGSGMKLIHKPDRRKSIQVRDRHMTAFLLAIAPLN